MKKQETDQGAAGAASSAMPRVEAYPECGECGTPYVLRRAIFTFDAQMKATPGQWVWSRDCKHKKAAPKMAPRRGGAA